MMGIMIIFERNKPRNLLVWTIIFISTQLIGYFIYIISRIFITKKRNIMLVKCKEDEIYKALSKNALYNNSLNLNTELLQFNSRAFDAQTTENNNYEFFNSYNEFKEDLIKTIKKATKSVLLQVSSINKNDFEPIKESLIEKAKNDILVKLVYNASINSKVIKQLKESGAKIYKFSKYNSFNRTYNNLKNVLVVDGETCYLGNFKTNTKQLSGDYDVCDCLLKLKGDMVQSISLNLHNDIIFASGKYMEYYAKETTIKNNSVMQYVVNTHEQNIELSIIKAISLATKSVQLLVDEFIPTDSIKSLLNFAIKSNIDVKLMVPLRANDKRKFYASRAFAKELALLGAKVYLYDGYIRFNSIVVDDEYVLYGNFELDKEQMTSSLQNILIIKDVQAVNHMNKLFSDSINNSYKINNANYMLLREKIFKNFV